MNQFDKPQIPRKLSAFLQDVELYTAFKTGLMFGMMASPRSLGRDAVFALMLSVLTNLRSLEFHIPDDASNSHLLRLFDEACLPPEPGVGIRLRPFQNLAKVSVIGDEQYRFYSDVPAMRSILQLSRLHTLRLDSFSSRGSSNPSTWIFRSSVKQLYLGVYDLDATDLDMLLTCCPLVSTLSLSWSERRLGHRRNGPEGFAGALRKLQFTLQDLKLMPSRETDDFEYLQMLEVVKQMPRLRHLEIP